MNADNDNMPGNQKMCTGTRWWPVCVSCYQQNRVDIKIIIYAVLLVYPPDAFTDQVQLQQFFSFRLYRCSQLPWKNSYVYFCCSTEVYVNIIVHKTSKTV